jgi:hypothetical protein
LAVVAFAGVFAGVAVDVATVVELDVGVVMSEVVIADEKVDGR